MIGVRLPFAPLLALAAFIASAAVVWLAYGDASEMTAHGEPPLITAAAHPLKRFPDDRGGAAPDFGGVGELLSEGTGAPEERLLPRPEQPVTPGDVGEPSDRAEAQIALESLVSELRDGFGSNGLGSNGLGRGDRDEAGSGAGGPNSNDGVNLPSPARPDPDAVAALAPTGSSAADPAGRNTARAGRQDVAAVIPTISSAPNGRFRVQLAAVRGEEDARRAWTLFQDQLGGYVSGLDPFFERAETSNGVFYRVQVGPFAGTDEADQLCVELKKQNVSCFVVTR